MHTVSVSFIFSVLLLRQNHEDFCESMPRAVSLYEPNLTVCVYEPHTGYYALCGAICNVSGA